MSQNLLKIKVPQSKVIQIFHSAIDDLITMNKSVTQVIEKASKNIQNIGESFEQTDHSIGNDIAKN